MLHRHAEVLIPDRAVRVAAALLMTAVVAAAFVAVAAPLVAAVVASGVTVAVSVAVLLPMYLRDGLPLPHRLTIAEAQLHLPEVIQVEARHVVLHLLPLLPPAAILLRAVVPVQAAAIQAVVPLPVLHRVVAVAPQEAVEDKMLC